MYETATGQRRKLDDLEVGIVDYGLANIQSVVNAVECFTAGVTVADDVAKLSSVDRIILPGVGNFDAGMRGLRERGFETGLAELVLGRGVPLLGVCLGFQFLFEGSEEGFDPGLGWLPGRSLRLPSGPSVKVPHMGWSEVTCPQPSKLFQELTAPVEFYFVHSFAVPYAQPAAAYASAVCEHGAPFVAAIEKDNVFGTQFHPEKSQLAGMKLLETFLVQ